MDFKIILQASIMAAGIIGGYAVVRQQLARVIKDLSDHIKETHDYQNVVDRRLDAGAEDRAVLDKQVSTLTQINSVEAQAKLNTRLAKLEVKQDYTEKKIDDLKSEYKSAHNGKHPPV